MVKREYNINTPGSYSHASSWLFHLLFLIKWTPPMRKRLRSKNVVHARRVLLAFGREACAALRSATTPLPVSTQAKSDKKLSSTQSELIGTMVLPSPISGVCLGGGEVSFDASLPACLIYSFQPTESITNENAADDGIDTVMCFCLQDTPPPNRFQWVETLLLERIKTHE